MEAVASTPASRSQGKTVGVVGLGRIGVLFAQRMAAFGTRLIAYDPYVQPARAAQLGVRLVGLEELLRESDFISIHLPKTPETVGPDRREGAGAGQAGRPHHQRRPRWPGRRAGAGRRDRRGPGRRRRHRRVRQGAVHRRRRCSRFDNVVATPHLGASTARGAGQGRPRRRPQRQAGAAGRVRARRGQRAGRRRGRRGRPAAAAAGREAGPGLHRGRRRRRRQRSPSRSAARSSRTTSSVLKLAATKGLFAPVVEEQVTYVNAPQLAADRGVEVALIDARRRRSTTATWSPCAARCRRPGRVASSGTLRARCRGTSAS